MFTQLCQVEHCLYEPKFADDNQITHKKWKSLDYILDRLKDFRKAIIENEVTRNSAHMFKIIWFKGYSVHGRK